MSPRKPAETFAGSAFKIINEHFSKAGHVTVIGLILYGFQFASSELQKCYTENARLHQVIDKNHKLLLENEDLMIANQRKLDLILDSVSNKKPK